MKLTPNGNGTYVFTYSDTGAGITLTGEQLAFLHNEYDMVNLRSSIEYRVNALDGDTIDTNLYECGTREDFIEEVFEQLKDRYDLYGKMPDDDDIDGMITDLADDYDMCLD